MQLNLILWLGVIIVVIAFIFTLMKLIVMATRNNGNSPISFGWIIAAWILGILLISGYFMIPGDLLDTPSTNSTATVEAATLQANTTQTAIAVASATDAVNATETAMAEAATAEANATQTAIMAASAADAANATETAMAEAATAEANATQTAADEGVELDLPPLADAIVIGPAGLRLRSGPGTNYNIIDTLNNGDTLIIQGRIANNDWIQVFADNPGLGWVYVPNLVQVNVALNDIPVVEPPPTPTPTSSPTPTVTPTVGYQYEFGPKLYEPKPWVVYPAGTVKEFMWEQYELGPDQYYSVRVVLDVGQDNPEPEACIHIQTREPKHFLTLECPEGSYYWSVVVATKLPEGGEHEWHEDSAKNHKNPFGIGVPHKNTPPGGGGGGDGNGGGGSGNCPGPDPDDC